MGKIKLVMCERCKVVQDFKDVCKCGSPKFVDLNMSKQSEFEKVVESLIDDVAIAMYCDENHSLSDELERNEHEIAEAKDVMQRLVPQLAAHILEVVEGFVNKGIGSGDFGARDMVVTMHHQGDSATARMLYDYLKQYINQEGGV